MFCSFELPTIVPVTLGLESKSESCRLNLAPLDSADDAVLGRIGNSSPETASGPKRRSSLDDLVDECECSERDSIVVSGSLMAL